MYRLMLYGLLILAGIAILFGFFGRLPYSGLELTVLLVTILTACLVSNFLFSKLFKATTNFESAYITALILFFLLVPSQEVKYVVINFSVGILAMATKYFFAIKKKHLFNPAAFSVLLFGLFGITNAIWWGAGQALLPFTTILGLLIVRKIRRFHLLFSFLAAGVVTISFFAVSHGTRLLDAVMQVFLSWQVIFLGTIMLTEPLTSPTRKTTQMIYGMIVGVLLGLQFRIGPIFSSPELALVIGNLFTYFVSSKEKLFLQLKEMRQLTSHIYEFIFPKDPSFQFLAGQYLEWTLGQKHLDARGNRRYFTIASSPTERELRLGVRYSVPSSSFKETLTHLPPGGKIIANQLGGDFVLPKDLSKKLVFIAGGIGITPFRSMIKYLIDTNQKRNIILFYSNTEAADIVYKDIFDEAVGKLGITVHYVLTDKEKIPQGWTGIVGRLSSELIVEKVPDYKERIFYLSGPNVMVNGYKQLLRSLRIRSKQIVTDYFPGY